MSTPAVERTDAQRIRRSANSQEKNGIGFVLAKLVHIADYISLHDYEGNDDYYEELGSIQRVDTIFS